MNFIVLFALCIICSSIVSAVFASGLFEFERRNYEELNAKLRKISKHIEGGIDDGK